MKRKVTVTLPENLFRLSSKKSKTNYGDNGLPEYIRDVLRSQFAEEQLENELKPLFLGKTMKAGFTSTCYVCNKPISEGEDIYLTDLGLKDDYKNWVHSNCCRKE